jgi:pantoate--beta-alanine ligase
MGALHDGHVSLIRLAKRRADRVVVSIFVNPTQFGPAEDFSRYPRTFGQDLASIAAQDADLVWAPNVSEMYPDGFATRIDPAGAAKAGLEDAFRPHFFSGVATVVAKLFIQVGPDWAIFGQKDYQQLMVVTQMARDLNLPLKVVGAPTIRQKDGLAMSSRNVYLSPAERAAAPVLYRALKESAARIAAGDPIPPTLEAATCAIAAEGFQLDYFEARHAQTLAPVRSAADGPLRLLVAARIGKTRLIDNIAVR